MIIAGVLLFLGLLLVFLEFYLPGGIMGAAGGIAIVTSIVVFAFYSPHPLISLGFGLASVVLFGLLVKFTLNRIRHSRPESSIYLNSDQEGSKGATFEAEAVGRIGLAMTDMRPSGHIRIAEKRYQAVAQVGFISRGTKVRVVGGEGGHLVVMPIGFEDSHNKKEQE